MSKLSNDYEGRLAVCRIDVLDNPRKSEEYGVTRTPTSLYLKSGATVNRLEGGVNYEKLQAATEKVLQEEPAPSPGPPPPVPAPPVPAPPVPAPPVPAPPAPAPEPPAPLPAPPAPTPEPPTAEPTPPAPGPGRR